jgi:hypothetical protein
MQHVRRGGSGRAVPAHTRMPVAAAAAHGSRLLCEWCGSRVRPWVCMMAFNIRRNGTVRVSTARARAPTQSITRLHRQTKIRARAHTTPDTHAHYIIRRRAHPTQRRRARRRRHHVIKAHTHLRSRRHRKRTRHPRKYSSGGSGARCLGTRMRAQQPRRKRATRRIHVGNAVQRATHMLWLRRWRWWCGGAGARMRALMARPPSPTAAPPFSLLGQLIN